MCRTGNGRLTLRELRRGDLLEALEALDQEDDINKVNDTVAKGSVLWKCLTCKCGVPVSVPI